MQDFDNNYVTRSIPLFSRIFKFFLPLKIYTHCPKLCHLSLENANEFTQKSVFLHSKKRTVSSKRRDESLMKISHVDALPVHTEIAAAWHPL